MQYTPCRHTEPFCTDSTKTYGIINKQASCNERSLFVVVKPGVIIDHILSLLNRIVLHRHNTIHANSSEYPQRRFQAVSLDAIQYDWLSWICQPVFSGYQPV